MSEQSPAPGVPQTGTKAQIATALTVAVSFVMLWVADTGSFTPKEIAASAVAALAAGGVVGIPTYLTKNKRI